MENVFKQIIRNIIENKSCTKKHPDLIKELDAISDRAKKQVVEGLILIYKFQHSIQIIRWIGMTHRKFDYEAWISVSTKLTERLNLEKMLIDNVQKEN